MDPVTRGERRGYWKGFVEGAAAGVLSAVLILWAVHAAGMEAAL